MLIFLQYLGIKNEKIFRNIWPNSFFVNLCFKGRYCVGKESVNE